MLGGASQDISGTDFRSACILPKKSESAPGGRCGTMSIRPRREAPHAATRDLERDMPQHCILATGGFGGDCILTIGGKGLFFRNLVGGTRGPQGRCGHA